jgi:hypothetical protein
MCFMWIWEQTAIISLYIINSFEEASGYMRPERVKKWPNSMTDRWWWWWSLTDWFV